MNSEKMDLGSKDLISNLPDALVCHILSFLSTKDAALTSILAKRWRYLLAFVPILDLDEFINDQPKMGRPRRLRLRQSFKDFVDRVMILQGNAPLNKFSLRCEISYDTSSVDGWILKVLEHGLVDLDLYFAPEYDYALPLEVFMSKTLVNLKLVGTNGFNIDVSNVGEVFLPKLKTLYLDEVVFVDETGAAFAKLVSGCHVLEELVMVEVSIWESCSVSIPTLKRLTYRFRHIYENPMSVSIDTPNLVYLEYSDTVAVKYSKVKLDSLVEASVCLRKAHHMIGDAADFLIRISNVKTLYLSSETLKVLTYRCKAIPVFNNLIHLTIETDKEVGWESLPNLLENCPNLESLFFEGLHYKDTNQCEDERYHFRDANKCWDNEAGNCMCKPWEGTPVCLSSSPVKILKVLNFGEIYNYSENIEKQTEMIKYFLETMPNLEQVILYYDTPIDDDLSTVSTELQMLEKVASPKCKIQVISDNISLSSTVQSSSSTSGLIFFTNTFPV